MVPADPTSTVAERTAGSKMPVSCSTAPSGATTALTPLVAAMRTGTRCSTARTRDMASCW